MLKTRNVVIALSSLLLTICLVLPLVMAAEGEPQRDMQMRTEDGMQPEQMVPQEMQNKMLDRIKDSLAATDQEWTAIEPPLKKVLALSNEINPRGMRMMGGHPGGRGANQPGWAANPSEQSELQKASYALREITQNVGSTPEEINVKLTAFRAAKEAAAKELVITQDELRKVVNARQEAKLVLMGMLN